MDSIFLKIEIICAKSRKVMMDETPNEMLISHQLRIRICAGEVEI